MATTFDYQTGRIEVDFHFVEWNTKCKGSGLPCKAGSERCQRCKYHGSSIHPWSFGVTAGVRMDESYILCKHPDAKDSKGCNIARHLFYEAFKNEALCALCY